MSASPVTIEELGGFGNFYYNAVVIIIFIISIYCLFTLWRKELSFRKKIIWSLLLIIPLMGPLLYGYCIGTQDIGERH
jgi:hypothetical protein